MILSGDAAALLTILLLQMFARQARRFDEQTLRLHAAHDHYYFVLAGLSEGVAIFDRDRKLAACNPRYGEIYGLPAAAMQRGTPLDRIVDRYFASCAATHEDITERCRAEQSMTFLARHDALTGLRNRAEFEANLAQALPGLNRGSFFAVLCVDLDDFSTLNDALGHAAGDEMLRMTASRLLATVREGDTVARLGGDAFAVLQRGVHAPRDAALLAEGIIAGLGAPCRLGGEDVCLGVSVGIEVADAPRVAVADCLQHADLARDIAKREGGATFRFFAPEMDAAMQNRRTVERDLRDAIARGAFSLRYQPIVDASSRALAAFDARVRWDRAPDTLAGADFTALAEETGLIVPIARWAMEQACRVATTWSDDVHVIVSLSPRQLRTDDLLDTVRAVLAGTGLDPARLELQITEAALRESEHQRLATLHRLRDLGVGIVLGEFGGGTSSLLCLRRCPFDRVRLDRAFVADADGTAGAACFLRAVACLCRDLGIPSTADGVETEAQLAFAVAQGCTHVEGNPSVRVRPGPRLAWLNDHLRPAGVTPPLLAPAPNQEHDAAHPTEALAEP